MKKNTIIILDVEITENKFPKLYRWAKRNPETLERTLVSLNKVGGKDNGNYYMSAINLEMDLQHG